MISDMFDSSKRFNVIEAGRRTGKTTFVLNLVRNMALEKKCDILVVWPNAAHVQLYASEIGQLNRVSLFVDYSNGSRVYFRSEKDIKFTLGMGFDYIVLDDCQRPNTWDYIRPMLADKRGGALVIGTDVWNTALQNHSKVT